MSVNKVGEAIEGIAKEVVKPVYEDIAQPAAKVTGKALSTVLNCFNLLLAPLERAQLSSAAKTEAFRKSLEEKYELIPSDKRQEPDLKVVYQIADKLKYNLDSDELRGLFENLLISSMTQGRAVHPLFVDVVDKMTTEDARIFNFVCENTLLTPDDKFPVLCLIELSSVPKDWRGYFLSCPHINGDTLCERDLFWDISGSEGLPKHEDARLHLDALINMGVIEKVKQEPIGGIHPFEIKNDSIIPLRDDKWPFFPGLLKRWDIEKWLINNCLNTKERSAFIHVYRYILTVFGQRLFESLRSPDDNRKLYHRY